LAVPSEAWCSVSGTCSSRGDYTSRIGVEAELGITGKPPAAERTFHPSVERVGPAKEAEEI
jgi:hypothetical protein